MGVLKLIPESMGGGAPELLRRTKDEWTKLKLYLEQGLPWPLGLVGPSDNPTENHQVLAYGYEDHGDGTGVIYLYDNNTPHQEQALLVNFNGRTLAADSSAWQQGGWAPLQGFFCSNYVANPSPPLAVGLSSGISVEPGNSFFPDATATFKCAVINVGYGPSPSLTVSSRGVYRQPHVEVVLSGDGEEPMHAIDQGQSRSVAVPVKIDGPLGRYYFFPLCHVVGDDYEVWKVVPPYAPGTVPWVYIDQEVLIQ